MNTLAHSQKGFTIVELLIVVAVVGVLVGIIFAALDPTMRFQQARAAVRQKSVNDILSALIEYRSDHEGHYPGANIPNSGEVYMLVDGMQKTTGCDDHNSACLTDVTQDTHCMNIHDLIDQEYLSSMPVSPTGKVVWDSGGNAGDNGSGYTVSVDTEGKVTVRACENEATTLEIQTSR